MAEPRVFYHGYSHPGGGHKLHYPNGASTYSLDIEDFPWTVGELDSRLCPKDQEVGTASFRHAKGWTVLAVWDRSGDERGNSNSVYLVEGTVTLEELKTLAEKAFPKFWQRMTKLYPDIKIIEEEAHGKEA